MTDKEQIKAIIKQYADKGERLYNESCETKQDSQTISYWDGYRDCANLLQRELNDIKKEPVNEDFEAALEKKIREAPNWTYIEEEGGECPLNEEFGAYDLEEFARWGADWVRHNEKEPVSEDLESFVRDYREKYWYPDDIDKFIGFAKKVANWQKQKDKDKVLSEEQCRKIRDDAFELGKDAMKQQMMKEAVNGRVISYEGITFPVSNEIKRLGLVEGEKVKVLIIKEE